MKLDFLGVSSPRERRNRFGLNDSWEIYRTFFSRSFDIDGGYGWMDGWRKGVGSETPVEQCFSIHFRTIQKFRFCDILEILFELEQSSILAIGLCSFREF